MSRNTFDPHIVDTKGYYDKEGRKYSGDRYCEINRRQPDSDHEPMVLSEIRQAALNAIRAHPHYPILQAYESGDSMAEIAEIFGIDKSSVCRRIQKMEDDLRTLFPNLKRDDDDELPPAIPSRLKPRPKKLGRQT